MMIPFFDNQDKQPTRPSPNGPHLSNAKYVVISLALLFAHDVSVAGTSSAGAATVVQAYSRPAPYVRVSRSTSPNSGDSIYSIRKQHPSIFSSGLRCGGAKNDRTSLPRRDTSALMAASTTGDVVKKNANYQLVWSPNFWKKMAISMALWLVAYYILKKSSISLENTLFSNDVQSCHGQPITTVNGFLRVFPSSVVLPLLSSSCCAIQLIINALSGWGCAGFNTFLGPIRPILLPLLLISTWTLLPQRPLGWTFVSLFLAFLPELVDIWNTTRSQQWQKKNIVEPTSIVSPFPMEAKLRLDIPSMGCVACVNKIDTSIRQSKSAANIRGETSWLNDGSAKGGMAELSILAKTKEEIDTITEEVLAAISDAGFQCSVESLQVDVK